MSSSDEPTKKTRRQKAFAVLPTLLTLGNAVCGFGAITILARVGPNYDVTTLDPKQLPDLQMYHAAQLIFLAMLFDALDGSAARLTNQSSEFGAMLDSLCDVVSFGVAPAFMMLKLTDAKHHLMDTLQTHAVEPVAAATEAVEAAAQSATQTATISTFPADWPEIYALYDYSINFLWAIAALFLACAILRLARFNVETDEEDAHDGFSGLPSPAAAAVIASFPIAVMGLKKKMSGPSAVDWGPPVGEIVLPALALLLPFITLATAVLMVSRIKYPHVFNQILRGDQGRNQLLQLVFTLALIFAIGRIAVPVIFCWFAFAAPVKSGWLYYKQRKVSSGANADES